MYVIPHWSKLTKDEMISSDAPDSVTTWDADTEYVTGDLVRSSGNTLFECAVGPAKFLAGQYCSQPYAIDLPNIDNDPDEYPTVPAMDRSAYPDYVDIDDCYEESGKLWWMKRDDEYENKYRMFAESPELVTSGEYATVSRLTMSFRNEAWFGTLAAVRTNASKITYTGPVVPADIAASSDYDPATDDPTYTQRLEWSLMLPTEETIYGEARTYRNFVMTLPNDNRCPGGSSFTVVLEFDSVPFNSLPVVHIGGLFTGFLVQLGTTLYNTTVGIIDYSTKERDAFGRAEIKRRSYTNTVNFKVAIDTKKIYAVKDFLALVRADICVYLAHPDLQGTVVAGYFKNFSIPYDSYTESIFTLEVEGL
jgi:hypothetical protein